MGLQPYEVMAMRATNGIALGGITLPAWLPTLDAMSGFAAQMVPILSAIWLIAQIARFVFGKKRRASNG